MTHWMLVSRDWLQIVLSIVFRDLWITSYAHIKYIAHICDRSNTSFVCELAGITDVRRHLAETYLIEYATTDSHRMQLLPGVGRYQTQAYAIPSRFIATVIRDYTPRITTLHFVLIDCTATYGAWDTSTSRDCQLHVSFAYTSPPPALLLDAPRGTFFPPPFCGDFPTLCRFDGVRRLVVRDANADFVAFLTTACPQLERVESTAEFRAEDVPQDVSADVKDRLVFVHLPRTTMWGLTGSDMLPNPEPRLLTLAQWRLLSMKIPHKPVPPPAKPCVPEGPVRKRSNPLWRLFKRVFRERN
ncbi:hypothetical protein B0H13DRAFT_2447823 [Mycena leptocephala]|nr:hypothetical protein B0H13DRAFT_2447823 [Mycena leptocephala]